MTQIEQLYRQKVVDIYNRIALTGLPERDPRLNDIPLDKIFIQLTMAVESAFQSSIPFELLESKAEALEMESKAEALEMESKAEALENQFRRRQWEREQKARPPEPIALATALQKHSRLFISGVPGSGKTTLLRWLAVIFANQQQAAPTQLGPAFTEDLIPVVLELRRFAKRFQTLSENQAAPFDLAHEISAFVGADPRFHGISEEWMRETLAQKSCLLLIDGLDEIADQHTRQNVLESLEAFVQIPNYAHVRCILTTRPHGFRDVHLSGQFQRTEIQPFTPENVTQFIHHWYETAYAFEYQEEAEELIAAIQAKPRVTEIAQNPLLCTIIAIIYRNNRILPNRRVELYLKCCEALLDTWERNKQIKASGLIGGFDWQVKLELLMPVAYWFHQQTEQLAMPEEAVVKQLANALEALRKNSGLQPSHQPIEQEARDFIAAIRDRSGLLQGRGDGTLEFTHRTFQEYLAARYIASQPDPEYIDLVMVHLHKAWWREVHLLVIGHLGSSSDTAKKAERLMLTILNVYKKPSRWLPQKLQWQRYIAWHLMREFELVAEGYSDCAVTARTETLTRTFSQLAMQRVLKWFKNPFYEEQLSFVLKTLKQQALPRDAIVAIFIKALQDNKDWGRYTATKNLGQLNDKSDKVIDALLLHLQDKDYRVRHAAADALWQLGEKSNKVIDVLLLSLQDKDYWVRFDAVESLKQLNDNSNKVIKALLLSLQDKHGLVRSIAAKSLGQLYYHSDKVIDALLLSLQDEDDGVRRAAAESLGQLDDNSNKVIEALLLSLQDKNEYVQRAATKSLEQLGKKSDKAIEALRLQEQDDDVRSSVTENLDQLGEKSDKVIDALLLSFQDKDYWVRRIAAKSLGKLKIKDKAQLQPVLIALNCRLHDSNSLVRNYAFESLRQLLDGRPIPGYRWKPLAKQQQKQKLRLFSLVSVLLGLILLVGFQLPIVAGIIGIVATIVGLVVAGIQAWIWLKKWLSTMD